MEATNVYFSSILEDTMMDNSTASIDYAEYRTSELGISSGNVQSSEHYQIVIKDTDQWLLMSKAYLQVRARLVRTDDTAIADTNAYVATLGAAGASVFSRMELLANGSLVDSVDSPQFVQLINCLTTYSKDKLESVAESEWLDISSGKIVTGPQNLTTVATGAERALAISAPEYSGAAAQVWEHGSGCAVIKQLTHGVANVATSAGSEHPLYNAGFAARWNRTRYNGTNGGREFEFIIPLSSVFGFCRDIKSVCRGVRFELSLQKNVRPASIMHGSGQINDTAGAVSIAQATALKPLLTKISLWVPHVTPALETVKMLEAALSSSVISKQYFENVTTRFSDEYPAGTVDFEHLLSLEGHKPVKIYFMLQRQRQYGNQNDVDMLAAAATGPPVTMNLELMSETHANPSTFSTLCRYDPATKVLSDGISEIELKVNSKSLPREKYRISFGDANPEFERVYVDFLRSCNKYQDESGAALSLHDYKHSPVFAFDLSNYSDIFSGLKTNDIRLRARITNGSPTAFRLLYVVYSERELIVQPLSGKLSLKV